MAEPLSLMSKMAIIQNAISSATGSRQSSLVGPVNTSNVGALDTSNVGEPSTNNLAQPQSSLGVTAPQKEEPTVPTQAPMPSGPVKPSGGNPSKANSANQQLGQQMAAQFGWDKGDEWTALNNVVMRESGWDATAANPTSDARGIAQNINGWSASYQEGNAQQQISWLLNYIHGRYGTPQAAWQHEINYGWY